MAEDGCSLEDLDRDEIHVHLHLSDGGPKCKTLVLAAGASLSSLIRQVEAEGLPIEHQYLCVMPKTLFTKEDIEALIERTKAHSIYVGEDEDHNVDVIHGFMPLVRRAETAGVRSKMKQLEKSLADQDGTWSQAQLEEAYSLVCEERQLIAAELNKVSELYQTLRTVVYDLSTCYREIYSSVHNLIRTEESTSLTELDVLVPSILDNVCSDAPRQTFDDLPALLSQAHQVKRMLYDPFFVAITCERSKVKFISASVKGIWRCVEKMEFRLNPTSSCACICDVVRGALCSMYVSELVGLLRAMHESGKLEILRIKNRLRSANSSGWADVLVNFRFKEDPTKLVCEVQLVHEKLMLVRKNMGAHASYSFFRTALEMLETSTHWTITETTLSDIFLSTSGTRWTQNSGWYSHTPVREWKGIELNDEGFVVKLDRTGNNLQGQISRVIGNLSFLRILKLDGNKLVGTIPESIGMLSSLTKLYLDNNQLTGKIPDSIGNLTGLMDLQLHRNNLRGPIPTALGNLTLLHLLFLGFNELEGEIPEALCNLQCLTWLDLRSNNLTGIVPDEIANLTLLKSINLGSNQFSYSLEQKEQLRAVLPPRCKLVM